MKHYFLFLFFGLFLVSASCRQSSSKDIVRQPSGKLAYDLQHPSQKFFMPDMLEEISGIAYYKPNQLLCVQDEEGKVFLYDLNEERSHKPIRFGKDGDYEDLAIVGDTIYVVKSNGVLHRFKLSDERKVVDEELATPLTEDNDVEGLCLDTATHQLWLICKAEAGIRTNEVEGYAAYAYNLATQQLDTTPVIHFQKKDIAPIIRPRLRQKKKSFSFKPSAIAIHPIEHRIYILSANDRFLAVLNPDGTVFEVIPLSAKVFRQPEGMCFSPSGELFISSEGDGQAGYVLRFDYLK